MIRVKQTRTGVADGNCFAACIASVFESSIHAIPWPTPAEMGGVEGWQGYLCRLHGEFLAARGYYLVTLAIAGHEHYRPPGYSLLGVETDHGTLHSVVCLDGKIVWDPYPGGLQLGEWRDWTLFVPLDPHKHPLTNA